MPPMVYVFSPQRKRLILQISSELEEDNTDHSQALIPYVRITSYAFPQLC